MSDEISVRVDTESEAYPALSISQIGNPQPDEGFLIPAELWIDLIAVSLAVDAAETAIMRHIAERYPEASYVRYWLGEAGRG